MRGPITYAPELLLWKKNPSREAAAQHLKQAQKLLSAMSEADFKPDTIKTALWPYAEQAGKGDVLWPLRAALTGQEKSPDPFVSAFILGQAESLSRIDRAIELLGGSLESEAGS
jgi:glutamyl/glutaminyl-tRNA synthetase